MPSEGHGGGVLWARVDRRVVDQKATQGRSEAACDQHRKMTWIGELGGAVVAAVIMRENALYVRIRQPS